MGRKTNRNIQRGPVNPFHLALAYWLIACMFSGVGALFAAGGFDGLGLLGAMAIVVINMIPFFIVGYVLWLISRSFLRGYKQGKGFDTDDFRQIICLTGAGLAIPIMLFIYLANPDEPSGFIFTLFLIYPVSSAFAALIASTICTD